MFAMLLINLDNRSGTRRSPRPRRHPVRCSCACTPAPSAGPICTSLMATSPPQTPLVLGHQIVGTVEATGARRGASRWAIGSACRGSAGPTATAPTAARAGRTSATMRSSPATTSTAATPSTPSRTSATASRIPAGYPDEQAAPLLCAGLIGYRAYTMTGDARRLGLYGFGNAAHILAQVARHQGREVFAFTRPGDTTAQHVRARARRGLGGRLRQPPPEKLDAAILFAAAGDSCPPRCGRWTRAARSSAPRST